MSDQMSPKSAEMQQQKSITVDVGMHFQLVTEDDKEYSRCLLSNCGRYLPGNNIGNMETHLKVAHNIKTSLPAQASPVISGGTSSATHPRPLLECSADDSKTLNQKLSESTQVRKYFEIVTDGDKLYSKCLVKKCRYRIAGNHMSNLKRHLRAFHDANWNQSSSSSSEDDENDVVADDVLNSTNANNAVENEDAVRKYFRFVSANGKVYSMCAIRGCKQRLADGSLSSLKRHLKSHRIIVTSQPKMENVHKYFQCVTVNGRLQSTCLIDGCGYRLAGNHGGNLKRHLNIGHSMNFSIRKCLGIGKYFQAVEIDGKSCIKCLLKGCREILENTLKSQARHMITAHRINVKKSSDRRFAGKNHSNPRATRRIKSTRPDGSTAVRQAKQSTMVEEEDTFKTSTQQEDCGQVRKTTNSRPSLSTKSSSAADRPVNSQEPKVQPIVIANSEVRKYFSRFDVNGKLYSKCVMDGCDYTMAGNHLSNLKRHLFRAHQRCQVGSRSGQENPNSSLAEADQNNVCSTNLSAEHKSADGTNKLNENEHSEIPLKVSENAINVRIYFENVTIDDKLYSRCLINGCKLLMSGSKWCNMKRHLINVHKIDFQSGRCQKSEEADPVRKFFRKTIESGKVYSECMIKHCAYRLAGNHLSNLKRHLRNRHDMEFPVETGVVDMTSTSQPSINSNPVGDAINDLPNDASVDLDGSEDCNAMESGNQATHSDTEQYSGPPVNSDFTHDVQKYFRRVVVGGKAYSACLWKGCNRRIAGDRFWDMKRHLTNAQHKVLAPIATCRLCFKHKDNVIDIFAQESHIANMILLHFPSDEVMMRFAKIFFKTNFFLIISVYDFVISVQRK